VFPIRSDSIFASAESGGGPALVSLVYFLFAGISFSLRCGTHPVLIFFMNPKRKKNLLWLAGIALFAVLLWGLVIFLMLLRGPAQAM
jgi:hypothetical protein